MSKEQERALAENEYTLTAFDYQKDPVGSRDWTLFWKGWQAARAASPVSAPTKRMMVTSGGWIHEECPDCRGVCSPVIVHPDECAKYDDGARAVAPVSAEQPTPCTCCNDLAQIAAEFADASRADNEEEQLRHRQRYMGMLSRHITTGHVAAPSVASEDSATQPDMCECAHDRQRHKGTMHDGICLDCGCTGFKRAAASQLSTEKKS